MIDSLSIMVHGVAKVGKTHFADTGPVPRLVLDAENGNRFTGSKKVQWDPNVSAPPEYDGSWETCVVYVRKCEDLVTACQWLESGAHPFKSVTLDSVSEVQQRCMDALVGEGKMSQQEWGDILRMLSVRLRKMRDLTMHPTNPVQVVTFLAMTRENKGKNFPYVQGQLQTVLPYITDCTLYLYLDVDAEGKVVRRALSSSHPQYEAGDRTGRLPAVIENPTIPALLTYVYGEQSAPAEVPLAPLAHSVSVAETVPLEA